jgi:DNA-nicking Smr family endonuclease
MFAEAREEARDLMRLRNACFQQATAAFVAGNGALAKRLAAEGRRHAAAMFAAHDSAASAIYNSRNAEASDGTPLLDLHGLHVAEALQQLRRRLPVLRAQHGSGTAVHVLVGTGHHTVGSKTPSRLPSAVATLLRDELKLRCREPQAGLLEVTL